MPPSARYRVVHETRYRYSSLVTSAHQLAHLVPRTTAWQRVLAHRLDIEPPPAERVPGRDYFGNETVRVAVDIPHEALLARAESTVEVDPHAPDRRGPSPPWEAALQAPDASGPRSDLELEQYRTASPAVPLLAQSHDYAAPSFARNRPWLDAVLELAMRIRADFAYDPEATTVTTRVEEVLEHRRGVCQDFAHLMLSCLRSLGLPARYVSGYVLNRPRPGAPRLAGADASHAWVASHCPPLGWVAFDPTNGKIADIEFVTLGWGREFSDVTPLRGVVLGAATQKLDVAVSVQEIDPGGADAPPAPAAGP
jgi:transglutaminase-like putative cysteine protease